MQQDNSSFQHQDFVTLLKSHLSSEQAAGCRLNENYHSQYSALLGTLKEGLFEWNIQTDELVCTQRMLDIMDIGAGTHSLKNFVKNRVIPEDSKVCEDTIQDILTNPRVCDFAQRIRVKTPLGANKALHVQCRVIRGDTGKASYMIGSVLDVEEQEKRDPAFPVIICDELTGMATKHALSRRLSEDIRSGGIRSAAVIVIDLDNLKGINDTLDHYVGDMVITKIGGTLIRTAEKIGLAVRLNNDEFAIYLPGAGVDEAVEFSRMLKNEIKQPMQVGNLTLCVTASLGISMYPDHAQTDKALLRYADIAMQHAKTIGKDTVTVFDYSMFERILRHETVARAIRHGLEHNEFSVYYQPQYSTMTGEIVGFEALLRLNSSLVGNVSPAEFIPAAEESGHIHDLGRWVFTEACKTAAEFQRKGYRFGKMSINLSLVQLQKKAFASEINTIIRDLNLDPTSIELEVTESQLVDFIDGESEIVKNMEALGFDLALDDFGSGYSSLNQLRQLWISTLKIDKKFIDHIATDPKDYEIVKLVVNLAHCLQLCVVAEGVETARQLELIRQIGCDKVQGYYYSRPVPKTEAESLLLMQKIG